MLTTYAWKGERGQKYDSYTKIISMSDIEIQLTDGLISQYRAM